MFCPFVPASCWSGPRCSLAVYIRLASQTAGLTSWLRDIPHRSSLGHPPLCSCLLMDKIGLIIAPALQGGGGDSMRKCLQSPGLGMELQELAFEENMAMTFRVDDGVLIFQTTTTRLK